METEDDEIFEFKEVVQQDVTEKIEKKNSNKEKTQSSQAVLSDIWFSIIYDVRNTFRRTTVVCSEVYDLQTCVDMVITIDMGQQQNPVN